MSWLTCTNWFSVCGFFCSFSTEFVLVDAILLVVTSSFVSSFCCFSWASVVFESGTSYKINLVISRNIFPNFYRIYRFIMNRGILKRENIIHSFGNNFFVISAIKNSFNCSDENRIQTLETWIKSLFLILTQFEFLS